MEPESRDNCVAARRGGKEVAGRSLGSRNTNRIRPQRRGEPARHGEARNLSRRRLGKCGGREAKVMALTRGGLPLCRRGLRARQRARKGRQKSAEVVVARPAPSEGPNRVLGGSPETRV
jgi:hypothetical protein